MGLFSKLFGRKQQPIPAKPPSPPPATPSAPLDPAQDPKLIRVFDGYGRELFITRETWRTEILPQKISEVWNDADQLYHTIVGALNDNFVNDVAPAAEHLYQIDRNPARGATVWAVVLMDLGRLDESEKVIRAYLAKHPPDGLLLTNLAKVLHRRGEQAKCEEALWHALEAEPNQHNGFMWYVAMQRENHGAAAERSALERISKIPGAWRAQLWLARDALQAGDLREAIAFYDASLAKAPKPAPPDLLMQLSGDLGNKGHLRELLSLTEPHFNPELHGLEVGNNLIKAHLDLGHHDEAQRILESLYSLKRVDWKEALSSWERQIAEARLAKERVEPESLEIGMLTIFGPVWLAEDSPVAAVFESKPKDELVVHLIAASVEPRDRSTTPQPRLTDNSGRLSRALPLFLAEQLYFGSHANSVTLIPWIAAGGSGFAVFTNPIADDQAIAAARSAQPPGDFLVLTHMSAATDSWHIDLRLLRTADGECVSTLHADVSFEHPLPALSQLAEKLRSALAHHAQIQPQPFHPLYQLPPDTEFGRYLTALEQLLATRAAAMDQTGPNFLSGPRDIIDSNLHLCLQCPQNPTTRILLARTVFVMKRIYPNIVQEFKERLDLLQSRHPLPQPAGAAIEKVFDAALD